MDATAIIIGIAALVIAAVGGGYAYLTRRKENAEAKGIVAEEEKVQAQETVKDVVKAKKRSTTVAANPDLAERVRTRRQRKKLPVKS